jgi:hypothetical protein
VKTQSRYLSFRNQGEREGKFLLAPAYHA